MIPNYFYIFPILAFCLLVKSIREFLLTFKVNPMKWIAYHVVGYIADKICSWFPDERPNSKIELIDKYGKIPKA